MHLLRYRGKSPYTWAEIGTFLVEHWWLVVLFFILFVPQVYLFHREYKMQMEERERYGKYKPSVTKKAEERTPCEDTYRDRVPSEQTTDKEVLFGERNRAMPKQEWKFIMLLLTLGFVIGMGGSVGGMSDVLILLLVVVLLGILLVAKHLPTNWVYTSFVEDGEQKKIIDWKGLRKELLPYGVAFGIGLLLGFLRLLLIG